MPTIEVDYRDLISLIGKKIPIQLLKEEGILYAKGEIEEIKGNVLKIDIKDTNRPDLWSAEGIARELQGRYGIKKGVPVYDVRPSHLVVKVDRKLSKIRPLTACAIVEKIELTQHAIHQIIQLQEKISTTFGRNRREVAIGIYDYDKIVPPIRFTSMKPEEIRFVPLGFDETMTASQILERHPKGIEYGHLLSGLKEYPVFLDAKGNILSMPPIINSEYTGKVTEETKNLFIECSGFDFRFLLPALNVIVAALADRGGLIRSVKIEYHDCVKYTPDMRLKKSKLNVEYVNRVSGIKLDTKAICKLLEQARYGVKLRKNKIEVSYPAYRQDIMHQRDIVEDIIISYGYSRIEPISLKLATVGEASKIEIFSDVIAETMLGLGMQEIMSYMLTNKKNIFEKMNLKEERVVEIKNPVSENWNVFRNWLLPSILDFFSSNKHIDYPQKIFEIGDCVVLDDKKETKTADIRKLAVGMIDNCASYENITSYLDALMKSLGIDYELKACNHESFISGRVASIFVNKKSVGIIGEIHPIVLERWKLEKPVVGFEIDISLLMTQSFQ